MPHYSRKQGRGSRDLGLSSNGKGSACRIDDNKAFAANYDEIDWGHKKADKKNETQVDEFLGRHDNDGSFPANVPDEWNITPPTGYRHLEPGEIIGPDCYYLDFDKQKWRPHGPTTQGVTFKESPVGDFHIRKLANVDAANENAQTATQVNEAQAAPPFVPVPARPLPPEGYVAIAPGERIQSGDMFFSESNQAWVKTCIAGETNHIANHYYRKA